MAEESRGETVAIVGAGLAGICLALDLKKRGIDDFVIYEREENVGGTWFKNAYPGCRCDDPIVSYSHSRHPNPYWTETHPPRKEILAYWQSIVEEQDLSRHINPNHTLLSATWDPETCSYQCDLGSPAGDTRIVSHRYLVSAIGMLSKPRWPKIDGLERFNGQVVHSARWPEELTVDELRGKKVVVVGNGCSGVQIVAELARKSDIHITTLARSQQWLVPGHTPRGPSTRRFSQFEKYLHSYRFILFFLRLITYLRQEITWGLYRKGSWMSAILQWRTARWMRKQAPPALRDSIIPPWPIGRKRVIVDPGYLKALNNPNVVPVWDGTDAASEEGIITSAGKEIPCDVLIVATGFELSNALNITGRDGSIQGNREQLEYYHGTTLPGFPNYFTMMGNNVQPLHITQVFMLEVTASYIGQVIAQSLGDGLKAVEVRADAARRDNRWLGQRTRGTVLHDTPFVCSEAGERREWLKWPGPGYLFWWHNAWPELGDYAGAEKVVERERNTKRRRWATLWAVLFALWYSFRKRINAVYRRFAL